MRVSTRVNDPSAIYARVAHGTSELLVGLIRIVAIVQVLTIRSAIEIRRSLTRKRFTVPQRITNQSACCVAPQLELRYGLGGVGFRRVSHILRVVHVASRVRLVDVVEVLLGASDCLLKESGGDLGLRNTKVSVVMFA